MENNNYVIYVNNVPVKVSKKIYYAYWKDKERERYLNKLARRHVIYLDHVFDDFNYNSLEYELIEDHDPTRHKAIKLEMIDLMLSKILLLNDEEQKLIHAIFFDELSDTEYAKILNVHKSTVTRRRAKILEKLRKMMK